MPCLYNSNAATSNATTTAQFNDNGMMVSNKRLLSDDFNHPFFTIPRRGKVN
jgi:hypothetical protein